MELTNDQKVLLEKTILHLHSFSVSLAKEFSEEKDIVPTKMLVHNMELCDKLEPLIKPYMSEEALSLLTQTEFCETLLLLPIVEDLEKIVGEANEKI